MCRTKLPAGLHVDLDSESSSDLRARSRRRHREQRRLGDPIFLAAKASTRNSDGMLLLQSGVWNWIDGGSNLDIQTGSANTVVNGLFVRLLETAKLLAQVSGAGSDVTFYQGLEDAVKSHFNQYFWRTTSNSYVFDLLNGAQSATIDDRSNAWAVLAGAPDSSRLPGVLNVLTGQFNASPYQERYIEEAMFQMGKDSEALARMLSHYQSDIDSWSQTMWERSGGAIDSNNHAWAASPTYLLGAFVAGVRPTAPGWTSYQVTPLLGTLTSVSATVPSVRGSITASHTLSATSVWTQAGFASGVTGISAGGTDSQYIKFNVAPGTWQFVAQ